jgi:nucleoside-diphosphate-sugar epimerase
VKVLVTGARGFLGRHVVKALCQRGHMVRALDRQATEAVSVGWGGLGVEQFVVDMCKDGIEAALTGVDAVVHLAAQVRGDPKAVVQNTLDGTRRLVAAMDSSEVRRLVLASSFSVYDWSRTGGELDENSRLEAHIDQRDAYANAKYGQEEIVRHLQPAGQWSVTILRPGALWGAGLDYPGVIGKTLGPLHFVFGAGRPLPLAYVENCADAFAAVVDHPQAAGEVFNIVDDETPQAWEYAGQYLRRRGKRGVRVPVAYGLAHNLARAVCPLLAPVVHQRMPSILLVPRQFEARFKPLRFSNRKLTERLGWRPPFNYEECLLRTFQALQPPKLDRRLLALKNGSEI